MGYIERFGIYRKGDKERSLKFKKWFDKINILLNVVNNIECDIERGKAKSILLKKLKQQL